MNPTTNNNSTNNHHPQQQPQTFRDNLHTQLSQ